MNKMLENNPEKLKNGDEIIQDEVEALVEKEAVFIDAIKLHGITKDGFFDWIEKCGSRFRRVFIEKAQEGKYTHEDFEEFAKELEQIISGQAELENFPKLKDFIERVDRKVNESPR